MFLPFDLHVVEASYLSRESFLKLRAVVMRAVWSRERNKMLLLSVMVGGVWNGFLLGKVRGDFVSCRFCDGADGDGLLF